MAISTSARPATTDAELVQAARAGDTTAFRDIVVRYQPLVCSLAYSGTGSFSRSEDIAQETFVAAWKQLGALREPGCLRSWLCGIARRLTSNAQRRAAHDPGEGGVAIDESMPSPEPLAIHRVMTSEEESLVWQALGTIPETYRKPLILFYRAHRSVAQVAVDLQLSEDAVKQRLSRGRALLTDRVLAVVEGALEQTSPSGKFTVGVMAIVSNIGPTAGLAAMPSAKAIATGSKFGAAGSALGLLALPAALGSATGWLMRQSSAQSEGERLSVRRMWQSTVVTVAAVVVPTFVLVLLFGNHARVRWALSVWLSLGYVAIGLPFAIWAWQNHVRVRQTDATKGGNGFVGPLGFTWFLLLVEAVGVTVQYGFPSGHLTDIPLGFAYLLIALPFAARVWTSLEGRRVQTQRRARTVVWVAIGTIAMAVLFAFSLFDTAAWRSVRVSTGQARVIAVTRPGAKVFVLEYQDGERQLEVLTTASGDVTSKRLRYFAPLSVADYNRLKSERVRFTLLRQGENFELLGTPGRLLFLLSAVVVFAGVILLAGSAYEWWKQRRNPLPIGTDANDRRK